MQKITTFLWFNDQAEQAVKFYVSIFKNSKVDNVVRYDGIEGGPVSSVTVVQFTLEGQQFTAFDGGPMFTFNPAISLVVDCETQPEIDHYWDKLTADGGEAQPCGWLKDKYGLSWQIVPSNIAKLMGGPDPVKSKRVMQALMQMSKLDIARLQQAFDGK